LAALDRLRIALDVSEGMRFLHGLDLYHRDLKSMYVLLDPENRAKLTGFGGSDDEEGWCDSVKPLATKIPAVPSSFDISRSYKMTADSEEEKLKRKQADIAAFGVILWELITGKVPKSNVVMPTTKQKKLVNEKSLLVWNLAVSAEEVSDHPDGFVRLMQRCNNIDTKEQAFGSVITTFADIHNELYQIWEDETKKLKDQSQAIPDGFLCPITQDVMKDPVILMDGHSYERKAIMDWLKRSNRSPLTNEEIPMASKDANIPLVVDNFALKSAIAQYLEGKKHKKY
jgi:serine/threonine protein kinase